MATATIDLAPPLRCGEPQVGGLLAFALAGCISLGGSPPESLFDAQRPINPRGRRSGRRQRAPIAR